MAKPTIDNSLRPTHQGLKSTARTETAMAVLRQRPSATSASPVVPAGDKESPSPPPSCSIPPTILLSDRDPYIGQDSAHWDEKRRLSTPLILAALEDRLEKTYLLLFSELPNWRRDNPAILTGYRPESGSWVRSASSLFYLHNESVNVWTHLLGAAAFFILGTYALLLFWEKQIATATSVMTAAVANTETDPVSIIMTATPQNHYAAVNNSDRLVFACFFGGAVGCLSMSATYHLLSNHSEHVAKWGNKLDYTGIVVLIMGSYVPALYYGLFCRAELMALYLYLVCLVHIFDLFGTNPQLRLTTKLTHWGK